MEKLLFNKTEQWECQLSFSITSLTWLYRHLHVNVVNKNYTEVNLVL